MSLFLTTDDIRAGRKVLYKGRIVTPIGMKGSEVKLAEDGKWYPHKDLQPLTFEQIRDEDIATVRGLVEGKSIATVKTLDRGIQIVMQDNTRIGVTYGSNGWLTISVLDPEGNKVL